MRTSRRWWLASVLACLAPLLWLAAKRLSRFHPHDSGADLRRLVALAREFPNQPQIHFRLGKRLLEIGDGESAASAFRRAIDLENNSEYRIWLARALMKEDQDAQAASELQKVLNQYPRAGHAHMQMGLLHGRHEAFELAVRELRMAAKLLPDDPAVWQSLGESLTRLRERDGAKEALERALRLRPDDADILVSMARFHLDFGEYDAATEWIRRALALRSEHPDARTMDAAIVCQRSATDAQLREAENALRQVVKRGHENGEAHLWLGRILFRRKKWTEAIDEFQESLRIHPGNEEALFQSGQALLKAGEHEAGHRTLQEFRKRNEYRLAVRHLQLRIARDPKDAALRFRLARLYASRGERERAILQYAAGLRIEPSNTRALQEQRALAGTKASSANPSFAPTRATWQETERV